MTIADDATDLIGGTPLVRPDAVADDLVGALEYDNPANSSSPSSRTSASGPSRRTATRRPSATTSTTSRWANS
jgi:hypothetical protein